ncbi:MULTISPECIES: gamma-glutamylcyclotransferase family protein [Niastella]|uniref:Gamma-glutamylcyclotransferase n=1 Tax=Niastella soli TaxID=2821487 RepID=A0ABS3YN18_9BACT|nr:gamma-glutamylcyclotransferase family protein [Niastella soli]MBO9199213.1 gamma-glutamylcyclotransferase [Niastella soli]
MQSNIYRLFVYGSLRSGFHNSVYSYISRYFIFDGIGSVPGQLFDMGEYPAAIPCTEDRLITGELYHIAQKEDFDWVMEQLDDYEGLLVEPGGIPLFRREPVNVLFKNSTVIAWMYWYNRSITDEHRIDSGDYVAYKMGIGK